MRPRLFPRRFSITGFLFSLFGIFNLSAQDSVLTNHGEPMRVAYACAEDDLQWAGLSCDEDEPCHIYLELTSIVPDGKKILAAGNLHSDSATLASILLLSDDGGATWKEPAERLRGSALDQAQFYNLQTGWAAGETEYPLARDPFFLLTTDGGDSWRRVPIAEDGSPGAIQRFWFDSPQHGELTVDAGKASPTGRYLSFETETGGDNWSLRGKSDQLPKLLHAPPAGADSGWRVRSFGDGKAVQIEQRSGEQWKSVASFLIEVATCRIASQELKEPAPEVEAPAAPPPAPGQKPKKGQ